MLKELLAQLRHSFCVYLLCALNLIHAITSKSFDWLLWVSVALVLLSFILSLFSAIQNGK